MAITLGAGSGEATLRIIWEDARGERVQQNIALDPTVTDEDVIAILTDMEALSNAKIVQAALYTARAATGFRAAAIEAVEQLVAARAVLTFEKANPVNSAKTVAKGVQIPAYIGALYSSGKPVTNNATLNALVAILENELTMQGSDGTYYPDNWTYVNARSGFVTVPTETDGL